MKVPHKDRWNATASSGDPRLAVDDRYATTWTSKPAKKSWLKIDLGKATMLAGLEVYWGREAPVVYGFKSSLDGKRWTHLCRTGHGEGGQDVFAFPPVKARFVRWTCDDPQAEREKEIVEINFYGLFCLFFFILLLVRFFGFLTGFLDLYFITLRFERRFCLF